MVSPVATRLPKVLIHTVKSADALMSAMEGVNIIRTIARPARPWPKAIDTQGKDP
jgi:hypothetical protein